jgi:hypothetical protein
MIRFPSRPWDDAITARRWLAMIPRIYVRWTAGPSRENAAKFFGFATRPGDPAAGCC